MPELPEVETIKNDLRNLVIGRTIVGIEVLDPQIELHIDISRFVSGLVGQKIASVDRRAKFLLVRLTSEDVLAVQLMITGQLLLVSADTPRRKSTRIVFQLDREQSLYLNDASRLARVHLWAPAELKAELGRRNHGPEPLWPELTLERFRKMIKGRRTMIKPLLLNQSFIAGLGNIYTDEILFAARIAPTRKATEISDDEIDRIYIEMRRIIAEAIELRGTTVQSYRDVLGRKGNYQTRLKVFRKTGEPCDGCDGVVVETTVGSKDTFHCPSCQI